MEQFSHECNEVVCEKTGCGIAIFYPGLSICYAAPVYRAVYLNSRAGGAALVYVIPRILVARCWLFSQIPGPGGCGRAGAGR